MKTISTIITLLLLGSALQAQPGPCSGNGTFVDSGQALGQAHSTDVALADFDGDGDLDAFVTNEYQPDSVWINQGGSQTGSIGNFLDSGQVLGGNSHSQSVALGDLDGDSDIDAYVAGGIDPDRVWINQGGIQGGPPGEFLDSGQAIVTVGFDVSLGDLDGDSDLDAFVVSPGHPNRVLINQGGDQLGTPGQFQDSGQTLGDSFSRAVALGDIDGDGDLDAIVANSPATSSSPSPNIVWVNQGGIQAGTQGEFLDSGQTLGFGGTSLDVSLGDIDLDGDLDAFVANANNAPNIIWINQGGLQGGSPGSFLDSGQTLGTGRSDAVSLGDIDGDNDLDAIVGNHLDQPNTVWINQGGDQAGIPGEFLDNGQALGSSSSNAASLGDVDNDGDLDVIFANFSHPMSGAQPNQVYLNVAGGGPDCNFNTIPDQCDIASGTSEDCNLNDIPDECDILANPSIDCDINGVIDSCELAIETTFVDSGQLLGTNNSLAVALGDVNGDGTLDMVVGNALNQANLIYSNDGSGNFTLWSQLPGLSSTMDIALGDIDGDNDLDIVVANTIYQPNQVLFNDGNGNFIDSGQTLGSNYTSSSVALGDVNGDGTLDMVVANSGDAWGVNANFIYLNDGSGTFTNSNQSLGNSHSRSLALGDIDGDTDLDLVVANAYGEANRVYINQGGLQSGNLGEFLDSNQQLGAHYSRTVALGDLNDDGFIDMVVGNQPLGGAGGDWEIVRLNDGNGNFSNIHQTLDAGTFTAATALGDLDGDGALDLVVGNWATITGTYPKNIVKLNEFNTSSVVFPSSGFVALDPWGATFRDTFDLALGDVDGDSDLDIVVVNSASNNATGTILANQVFLNNSAPSDCNENGIIDSCDISSGFSLDTNQNEIPDECEGMKYISGDGNGDGVVNVGDGIFVLDYLFGGGVSSCLDASDVNGDGVVDIGDAVYLLTYLFNGGSTPAAPFPDCGEDPTADALECDSSTACP
jgi:hypothetical protein